MNVIRAIAIIAEYEGLPIQEAKLSYAARQNLPATAFCGPEKSYPAQDAKHVRAGFQRLSQFGKKMPRAVAIKIYRCLLRRAKKYKIEHNPKPFQWLIGKKSVQEVFQDEDTRVKGLLEYLDKELGLK